MNNGKGHDDDFEKASQAGPCLDVAIRFRDSRLSPPTFLKMKALLTILLFVSGGCVSCLDGSKVNSYDLKETIAPKFCLANASISDAVEALHEVSYTFAPRRDSQSGYGYSFVLKLDPLDDLESAENPLNKKSSVIQFSKTVTIDKTNVSLLELIQEVCKQTDMTFKVIDGIVMIYPK